MAFVLLMVGDVCLSLERGYLFDVSTSVCGSFVKFLLVAVFLYMLYSVYIGMMSMTALIAHTSLNYYEVRCTSE